MRGKGDGVFDERPVRIRLQRLTSKDSIMLKSIPLASLVLSERNVRRASNPQQVVRIERRKGKGR